MACLDFLTFFHNEKDQHDEWVKVVNTMNGIPFRWTTRKIIINAIGAIGFFKRTYLFSGFISSKEI